MGFLFIIMATEYGVGGDIFRVHRLDMNMGRAETASTLRHSARRQANLDYPTVRALFYARECKSGVNPSFLGRAGSLKVGK